MSKELWYPPAQRVHIIDTGSMVEAPARAVMHTTEGSTAAGAIATFHATHDFGQFLTTPEHGGKVYQFVPVTNYGTALVHHGGIETNRMNALQIEEVGFSFPQSAENIKKFNIPPWAAHGSAHWPDSYYDLIHDLAVWLHHQTGVELNWHGVDFTTPSRMTDEQWKHFHGFCGHVHVPHQDPTNHEDPGTGYHIGKVVL